MEELLFKGVALVSVEAVGRGATEAAAKLDAAKKMKKAAEETFGGSAMITSVTKALEGADYKCILT